MSSPAAEQAANITPSPERKPSTSGDAATPRVTTTNPAQGEAPALAPRSSVSTLASPSTTAALQHLRPTATSGTSLLSVSSVFLPSKYKVVFLGDMSTGKTSIITRFMYNTFDKQEHTIGIDFLSKTMSLENRTVRLQLWDTAGQERYRSLISSYIRESQAAVLVYDVTTRSSFDSLDRWLEDVRIQCGPGVVIALVGNKTDLTAKRTVAKIEGEAKAAQCNALFFETSAKTGSCVQTLFVKLAGALPVGAASAPLTAPQPLLPPTDPNHAKPFTLGGHTSQVAPPSGGCKC